MVDEVRSDPSSNATAPIDKDSQHALADALKGIPWVGPILAFVALRGWLGLLIVLFLILVVLPFITPLLGAVYMKALPERMRSIYADFVTSAFSIDEVIQAQIRQIVEANNTNLDFVQNFSTRWFANKEQNGEALPRRYVFPLRANQEFRLQFEVESTRPGSKPCAAGSHDATFAQAALNDPQLFRLSIGTRTHLVGTNGFEERFATNYWSEQKDNVDSGIGRVEVGLNSSPIQENPLDTLGSRALKCWVIGTNLRVIVYKSLSSKLAKSGKHADVSAAEGPAPK